VKAEIEEGRQKGVTRTPTLFVNGRKIKGVPSYEDLVGGGSP
jgi:protein-disulfide isomerase